MNGSWRPQVSTRGPPRCLLGQAEQMFKEGCGPAEGWGDLRCSAVCTETFPAPRPEQRGPSPVPYGSGPALHPPHRPGPGWLFRTRLQASRPASGSSRGQAVRLTCQGRPTSLTQQEKAPEGPLALGGCQPLPTEGWNSGAGGCLEDTCLGKSPVVLIAAAESGTG